MKKLTSIMFAASFLSPLTALHAENAGSPVPLERMQQVYEEVKTPFKYGVVLRGEANQLLDSPSVFRKDGQWYMVYIASTTNVGYETCLARSADLLNWEKLGKILTHRPDGWDRWQRAGYIALSDPTWGGSNELQTYDGKYWMSYLGGSLQGYETDPLAIGLAWTETPTEAREWTPIAENPVLHRDQPNVRPFEKVTLYKSNIVWDKAKTLGSPFVMFYNGKISGGYEQIGMAVSDDMVHWKRYGADSVVANGVDKKHGITGDPQVVKMGDLWVMFYFGALWRPGAFDTFACSTDLVHWTKWTGPDLVQSSEPWDKTYAHKPWIVKHDGVVYHFYCAVGDQGRVIGLATSKDLKAQATPKADGPSQVRTLRNRDTRLDFDPQTGTYDVTIGEALAIDNAFAKVEAWSSTDVGYQRRIVEQGRDRLVIECSRSNAPTLLLEFTMHPAFVELRTGMKNSTAEPIRIKKFEPLSGGIVFAGSKWNDVRTLNAPSGTGHTRVTRDVIRSSANNLLLTFKQDGVRRSLVLGGLKTADFTKWAHTRSARSHVEGLGLRRMGYLDCGGPEAGGSPFRAVRGFSYTWNGVPGPAGSVLFDDKMVEFEVTSLDPKKRYVLGFTWCDGDANGRFQSVLAGGQTFVEKCAVPKEPATEIRVLPAESYRDGLLRLSFVNETNVPNAVVSELWLWEADADFSLPTDPAEDHVMAALEAYDPIGRQVEPGETYVPADSFYVDAATANPFEALEQYGVALREATGAKPNPYDFPTVCAWYAGVWKTPGAQDHPERSAYKINTTAGMIEEADKIKASGFLNYARVAGRLVPDNYTVQNPQGWWDDEHWQMHGFYTAPYETSATYGAGMHERGTLAFTYIQPVIQPPRFGRRISLDFREVHRDWFLNKDINREMDYSLPAVREHVRSRFAALRGHIDGLMVDYADQFWLSSLYGHTPEQRLGKTTWEDVAAEQGTNVVRLFDARMTATAYYRTFFSSLRQGLGPEARIHERNVQQPDNDLVLDLVDSQRTELDTDKISPELVSRSGLRWYKNRVVTAYDMDSKELYSAWKTGGWTGSDEDGRRMLLTMAYVAASRLVLANSFRNLDAATLHDLSRTFPYPTETRSARPVDAFAHDGWPRVYDFAVTPDWHQVTLFNNAMPSREETIAVPLAGDTADGALGLDPEAEYYVYDFWNDAFVGAVKGSGTLTQTLRPGEARMLSIRKVQKTPQVLSTNRHIMQGQGELLDVNWGSNSLSGKAKVVGGEPMKIVIVLNGHIPVAASNLTVAADGKLAVLSLDQPETGTVEWRANFTTDN